jgi:protein subunit release factor B
MSPASAAPRSRSRATTPSATCAPRPACTGWCARAPSTSGGRHTSFASLFVYPEVDDSIEIDINPADVRVDTFRASGAGGQHINKTDSAVRLTHIPTNIVVQCQNSRSQHSNRDEAWKMLRSRLYEHEMRKQQEAQQKLEDSKTDVGWGHQIRSYVLDNSRIKDLRTNVEISNTQKVLDGDLDVFIEASLKQGLLHPLPAPRRTAEARPLHATTRSLPMTTERPHA